VVNNAQKIAGEGVRRQRKGMKNKKVKGVCK